MALHEDLIAAGLPVAGQAVQGTTVLFTRPLTPEEEQIYERIVNPAAYWQAKARVQAAAIPDWATKDEEWILQWLTDNIGTPLAQPIPPNPMTVQQIRATLVAIIDVLGKIYIAQRANARMVIALRNEHWPEMQEE